MKPVSTCAQCGSPLSRGRLGGLCPTCLASGLLTDTPEDDSATQANGTRLRYVGDYELVEEIARGGMGVVYRARQISLNRIVALKMILAGELASTEAVRRFRKEAEAAAGLQHPNIVAIHEIGEHNGQPYFSMDLVEGWNLSQLGNQAEGRRPLPKKSAALLVTLARAIQYAHEQGTLHRDLKPSNVLIDAFDQPRITDFGLAKRLDAEAEGLEFDPHLTRTGQVVGTPAFMPPEQAAAKSAVLGPQSDVYALGAILYFLLTGKPPFVGESLPEIIQRVLYDDPIPPRAIDPSLPRDLETIALKCLEKEPHRRYASAEELAVDLERFLDGAPVLARPLRRVERIWRRCLKHRLVTTLIVAVLILPVTVGLLVRHYASRSPPTAQQIGEPQPIAQMPNRSAQGVAGVIDGKIYVTSPDIGVSDAFPKFLHVYDPAASSWERLPDSSVSHIDAAGGVIAGKLYVAGGQDGTNGPGGVLEAYDPHSNTWSTKAPMPKARLGCAGAVLNGKFYVVGGDDGTNSFSTVESYDPRTDQWITEKPMLTARTGLGVAAINGRLYAVGGGTRQSILATVETWKPGGMWTACKPMLTPATHAFVAASEDALYVAGGWANGAIADLQVFEPGRNIWDGRRPMPQVRRQGSGAAILNGELYLLGGWEDLPGSRLPHADVFAFDLRQNAWRSSEPAKTSRP